MRLRRFLFLQGAACSNQSAPAAPAAAAYVTIRGIFFGWCNARTECGGIRQYYILRGKLSYIESSLSSLLMGVKIIWLSGVCRVFFKLCTHQSSVSALYQMNKVFLCTIIKSSPEPFLLVWVLSESPKSPSARWTPGSTTPGHQRGQSKTWNTFEIVIDRLPNEVLQLLSSPAHFWRVQVSVPGSARLRRPEVARTWEERLQRTG